MPDRSRRRLQQLRRLQQWRRLRQSTAAVAAGALLLGLLGLTALPARAEDPAFRVSDARITAPTGLAADSATGSYWMVNADGARMFALSPTGQVKGAVAFRAQTARVEAAAYRSGRLYVGDIGDPGRNRTFVTVYSFPNLTPNAGTVTYQSWDLRYPDGAHDAKAMLVDPTGRLYLITTGQGAGIYAAPADASRSGVNTLQRVADAPDGVTDAVALSATRWAVRTASAVRLLDARSRREVGQAALPVRDGETLAVNLADAGALVAGSAGTSASVYVVAAPTGTPPTTTPRPAGSGGAGSGPAEDNASDSSLNGTWTAIWLSALLAVLAGVVVYLWPSRAPGGAVGRPGSAAGAGTAPPAGRATTRATGATRFDPRDATLARTAPEPAPHDSGDAAGPDRAATGPHRYRPPGDIEDDDLPAGRW